MRNYSIILLILIFLTGNQLLKAQQFPVSSHYVFNNYSLDPGFAGLFANGEAYLNYRKEWASFNGNPSTIRANGFTQIRPGMFLGGELLNDKVGIFNRFRVKLNYTYGVQLADIQYLNFSVWGSLFQSSINVDAINADPNDPLTKDISKLNGTDVNAGFSLVYNRDKFTLGFGMPTLFRTKDAYSGGASGKFAFEQEILFHISNRFLLAPDWHLQPFVMWSRTNNMPSIIDISATVFYMEKYWLTMLYRNSSMLAIGVGGELYQGLTMAYTYEIGMRGINGRLGGAHEISLGFRFGIKDEKAAKKTKGKKSNAFRRLDGNRPQPTEFEYRRTN
ncbi:MAG: PorP/SprF family type IX secretion system membrane protein [Bacteroidales bacterium]|nr:PorP/SprF family type IX secretion system membrane protein [Bacteroidales bacterium]